MPSARRHPNTIRETTAAQIAWLDTPPSKAGRSTSSVARPSAFVSSRDETANRSAPATDTVNGQGCSLM